MSTDFSSLRLLRFALSLLAVCTIALADEPRTFQGVAETSLLQAEGNWGGVAGQIVFDGEVPETKLLIKKDAPIKDAAVCAAEDHIDESLLIDPATQGIANCFVYIYRHRSKPLHPLLAEPINDVVYCDIKSCKFVPHTLIIRAGQEVEICSSDLSGHNPSVQTIKNQAFGLVLSPRPERGRGTRMPFHRPELLPILAKCDMHPWMRAYWLVVGHPYAAITNSQGRFRIIGLPAGEHEFRIWHERIGYIDKEYSVTISNGQVIEMPSLSVPASTFER